MDPATSTETATVAESVEPAQADQSGAVGRLVLKNTLMLGVAQLLGVPLSILVNAVSARKLGAEEYGYLYLAATYTGFGLLFMGWGHDGTLPALVARTRERSGVLLGSALLWTASSALVIGGMLVGVVSAFDYSPGFPLVMAIASLGGAVSMLVSACQETVRGFERTDLAAISQVGGQLLMVILVIPTLLLGGQLVAMLTAQAISSCIVLFVVVRMLKPVGVGKVRFERETFKELLGAGFPFVLFNLALVAQPNVDAFILSRYVPVEAVGWYSAARRLFGVAIYPATALIGALYPTLCRLYASDLETYRSTTRAAIRGAALIAIPAALVCALYPDVGIGIFGRESYEPAEDNLRMLAPFLVLVYISMPLGTSLLAAGRQRLWASVQALCVLVSLALDPFLVTWFHERTGNGGLGVCATSVISELLMVSAGVVLTPKGVFDRTFFWTGLKLLAAGLAMTAFGWATHGLPSLLMAPVALIVFGATLWAVGGVDPAYVALASSFVRNKLQRK